METSLQVSQDKNLQEKSLVQETISTFEHMRADTFRAMQLLYAVKQTDAWQDNATTFGEFVEQDLGISQSYASKLLSTWDHYVIQGGIDQKTLQGTDYERLYLARRLPGTVEEQASAAKTLSRHDIKDRYNQGTAHEHDDGVIIRICNGCGMRLYDEDK